MAVTNRTVTYYTFLFIILLNYTAASTTTTTHPAVTPIDCGPVTTPFSGSVSYTSGTTSGSNVTYSCSTGYAVNGEATRTCTDDGTWSGYSPTCITDCGWVPSTQNWSVYRYYYSTTYGSGADFRCHSGFYQSGYSYITCLENGTWSWARPTCTYVDCGELPSPINGSVTYSNGTSYGSRANFSCDEGYTIVGSTIRYCNSYGTWSVPATTCQSCVSSIEQELSIRLAGGDTSKGRVEVSNGTAWGSVCGDAWDDNDAKVVCKMLGYSNGKAVRYAYYGYGTGNILMDNVQCQGTEDSLIECCYNGWGTHSCGHYRDASVVCYNNDLPVRLVGGNRSTEGRLEVLLDGFEWGTVCDYNWNVYDARVVCGMLSYSNGYPVSNAFFGAGTGDIFMSHIYCTGKEASLMDCVFNNNNWKCTHSSDVSVVCSNESLCNDTQECTLIDEHSVCNQSLGVCQCNDSYTQIGYECVRECRNPPPSLRYEYVLNNTHITLYGNIFYQYVTLKCYRGFTFSTGEEYHNISCLGNGQWEAISCYSKDLSVRLVGGNSSSEGRIEVTADGTEWGPLCYHGWDLWNALVVCKMLGYSHARVMSNGYYGYHTGFYNGLDCEGTEGSLIDCPFYEWNATWCYKYASSVACFNTGCGIPAFSDFGSVGYNLTTYESTANYSCDTGYNLTGSMTRTCGGNGNWSGTAPTCSLKKSELGERCLDDSVCAVEGSACIDSKCVCPTGVYERTVNKCDTMPLFSYGPEAGDLNVPYSDDECNTSVKLTKIWIPIRGSIKRKFFICANGLISLNGTYTNPSPLRNRFRPGNSVLIAPFYADAKLENTSTLYYRWADVTNVNVLLSIETTFAQDLVRNVHRNNFTAKFVLFVTWLDVQPSISTDPIYERSTFQLVLLSDGMHTYVMYVYGHNKMNWKPKDKPNIWIGVNIGDHMETNMNSFHSDVYNIDKNVITGGIRGLLLYKLTPDGIGPTNYAIKCLDWFEANRNKQANNNNQLQQMPRCPCSLDRLVFDPWFTSPEPGRYPNTTCVHMWAARIYKPHGKTCCYDTETRLWIQQYPRAGGYQEYHPTLRHTEHQLYDINAKKWCCDKSDLCEMYYLINPVGDCYRETWFEFGTLWGDPHFKTVDGKSFIFNAHGEYTLVNSPKFTLQARTERALRDCVNCSLSFATIFSAFAARDVDNGSLHVELNKAKTGINVYGNDVDITKQYTNSSTDDYRPFTFQAEQGNLIITKRNGTLMALFPTSGISLNVSIGVQMLTVKVILPKSYRGDITGLLGNFDGSADNDFILPNKTMLPANMTEKQIFRYASEWSVDDNTSVFKYPAGFSHSDFSNASYIPMFLEDVNASVIEEAIRECGSEESISCVFDLIFTENKEVADDSRQTNDTAIATQKDVENETPSISGCERLQIEPGKTATCFVTFTDDDTKLDIVFLSNNEGAKREIHVLNTTWGRIDYESINLTDHTELSVTVVDERGARAVPVVVSIEACTGCSDHGVCSKRLYQENRGNRHFRFQQCICEQYYEGQDCEEDFDGCATEPCSHGRNCTDLSSLQHERTGQAFTCSPCKDVGGYVEDGDKCKDVNECEKNKGGCEQICLNSDGSFDCSCKTGYRRISTSFSQCEDINECDEALHDCQQICININGTFTCDCLDGFSYNKTKNRCTQVFDPCHDIGLDCSQTAGCTNTSGTPQCVCSLGYELQGNNSCRDIDECTQNVCQQNCINKDGGFKCSCWVGYKPSLTDPNACEGCDFPFWGESCTGICRCDGSGSSQCSPISGCVCNNGWTGESCEADIDECEGTPSICEDPYKRCINFIGSYSCDCIQGFQLTDTRDPTSNCQDIDECETPELNNCLQHCANGIGGYTCECYDGFYLDGSVCMDIDECQRSTSGCQHICDNKPGTFNCYCHFGYLLNDDRKTCESEKNPCASFSDLHCKDICLANDTHAWCVCNQGFKLAQDKESCIEIDECDNNVTNLCDDKDLCVNIVGSFTCSCRVGWKLENDWRSCKPCDEYTFGYNCNSPCECAIGAERCDPVQGCVCREGWTGNQCEVDRDECSTMDSMCTSQHSLCTNTLGSYRCDCMPGYQNTASANTCTDIDECADLHVKCDQMCHNTPGSYSCSCREGFILKNNLCQDFDECAGVNHCSYNCSNTIGGYRCKCPEGFKLGLTDRRSCIPISQCPHDNITTCQEGNAECYMANDSPTCKCKKGYQSDVSTPENCIDVDECTGTLSPCEQLCQNNKGGYLCDCREGYSLDVDGTSCRQCQDRTYGQNCRNECSCTTAKTASCDPVTGKCSCVAGWSGDDCNDDLDECRSSSLFTCPDNSACVNTHGSYTCQCNIGYFKTGDEICKQCEDMSYGTACANVCMCNTINTALCDNVDGSCTCKDGWESNTCNDDINECETSAKDVTCNDERLECINIVGSFRCDCKEGFYKLDGKCTVYIAVTIVLALNSEISIDLIYDYQNIKAKLERMLRNVYQNSRVTVTGIIGSGLVVDFRVPVEYKNVMTEMEVTSTTLMMVKGDVALQYDGSSVMALSATVDGYDIKRDTSVCDVYILVVGPCDEGETCTTENEQPVCRKPKTNGVAAFLIWIGVGSAVFIVVMVILICVVIRMRKTRTRINGGGRVRARSRNVDGRKVISNFEEMPAENIPGPSWLSTSSHVPSNRKKIERHDYQLSAFPVYTRRKHGLPRYNIE